MDQVNLDNPYPVPTGVHVEKFFEKTVDEAIDDDGFLDKFVFFMVNHCIFGAPKDEMMKSVKNSQLDLYFDHKASELANDFPSFLEYHTPSDLAFQCWQYINLFNDICMKKNDPSKRHQLKAKFTGDNHHRRQPAEGSDAMKLYYKLLDWFVEFKSHKEFIDKVRRLANKWSKKMALLPTWTETQGPKKHVKHCCDDDDDIDDEDVPELPDIDEAVDGVFFASISSSSQGGELDDDENLLSDGYTNVSGV